MASDAAKEQRVSLVFDGGIIDAALSIVLSSPILRFFEISTADKQCIPHDFRIVSGYYVTAGSSAACLDIIHSIPRRNAYGGGQNDRSTFC